MAVTHTLAYSITFAKHQTRLARLAKDKHSSLLHALVNYGRKSFIKLTLGVSSIGSKSRLITELNLPTWLKIFGPWTKVIKLFSMTS
jgi:hypothetical protein